MKRCIPLDLYRLPWFIISSTGAVIIEMYWFTTKFINTDGGDEFFPSV